MATGLVMAFPFIYMFLTSLKSPDEVVRVPPVLLPEVFRFSNYLEVLSIVPIGTQLVNSIIVTVGVVLGWLATSTLAGYAFARLHFPAAICCSWPTWAL